MQYDNTCPQYFLTAIALFMNCYALLNLLVREYLRKGFDENMFVVCESVTLGSFHSYSLDFSMERT